MQGDKFMKKRMVRKLIEVEIRLDFLHIPTYGIELMQIIIPKLQ